MIIKSISVSRKDCFEQCQQLYKYRYHLKIKLDETKEPPHLTYGTLIHRISELYVKNKGEVKIETIMNDLVNKKIPLSVDKYGKETFLGSIPQEYKMKLPEHLSNIKKINDQIGFDGLTELEFELDLDPPNKKLLIGHIDRLIEKNKKYFVLDFKTNKESAWRKTKEDLQKDVQLKTYAAVVKEIHGAKAEDINVALFYVSGGNLVSTKFTELTINNTKKDMLDTYKKIENTNPDTVVGKVGWWCKHCDYKSICPFYKKG